ncbi:hypothetical protein ACIHFD_49765 [Nonomuraea sp. NPDC051941]|uniref:hypothetical protein n=1 Tax=Nonomuraea sp. NPDC051941 TaxID=3364373 RepID=UPI0037CBC752
MVNPSLQAALVAAAFVAVAWLCPPLAWLYVAGLLILTLASVATLFWPNPKPFLRLLRLLELADTDPTTTEDPR